MAQHKRLADALAACADLGFSHDCVKTVEGGYAVVPPKKARKSAAKKAPKKASSVSAALKKALAAYAKCSERMHYQLLTSDVRNPVHSKRYGATHADVAVAWEDAQAAGATDEMRAVTIEKAEEKARKRAAGDGKKLLKKAVAEYRKAIAETSYLIHKWYEPSERDAHLVRIQDARKAGDVPYLRAFKLGATSEKMRAAEKAAGKEGRERAAAENKAGTPTPRAERTTTQAGVIEAVQKSVDAWARYDKASERFNDGKYKSHHAAASMRMEKLHAKYEAAEKEAAEAQAAYRREHKRDYWES